MHKIKFYVILIIFGFIFTSISDDIDLTETEDLFSSNKELSDFAYMKSQHAYLIICKLASFAFLRHNSIGATRY